MYNFNSSITKENTNRMGSHPMPVSTLDGTVKDAFCHSRLIFQFLKEISEDLSKLENTKNGVQIALKNSSIKVGTENDETIKKLKPLFDELLKGLCVQISLQKQENGKLQQKVADLKREKNNLQQMIILCAKKCSQMEEELGKYPK